jgi:hypothetical protein
LYAILHYECKIAGPSSTTAARGSSDRRVHLAVAGLEVAVDDALVVRDRQGLGDLQRDAHRVFRGMVRSGRCSRSAAVE